jgi:hypothetical protein
MLVGVSGLATGSALASRSTIPATPGAPAGGGPTPPWTITSNGSIAFYSAKAQVITGGSTSAGGLGAFAVAATAASSPSYTKATLFAFTPVKGQDPATWSGEEISLSTNFPNSSAPAPVGTTTNPVTTNPDAQVTLANYVSAFPNTNTDPAWQNLYDLRMKVSGLGLPLSSTYWDVVISVNTNTNTWSIDFPDWTQTTSTALSASPPSPQNAPANPVTLTATVTPGTNGTVGFWSGSTQVGTTQNVTTGTNTAQVMTTPPTGTTPYVAIFTPTIGSADIGSASSTLNYVVTNVTSPPSFEPTLFGPQGPNTARVGGQEFCVASFQNADTVTYSWQANGSPIGGQQNNTADTFTPGATLLGQALSCSVLATNAKGTTSGQSTQSTIALGAPLVPTTNPKISGPHVVGQKEKVTAGIWSPPATTVTYQWFIGTTKVTGATNPTFKVPARALGKKVHCVVTASAAGFASGVFTTPGVKIT